MVTKQSSGEKIIDVKRIVREEKPVQRINLYAALGIAILTVVVLTGFAFIVQLSVGNLSYEFTQLVGMSSFVAATAIFFSLPVLGTAKYGWRTVVTTLLLQSILIFFTVLLLSLFTTNDNQSTPYYNDTPGLLNGASLSN